ncbi:MAG: radical SAM protein [Chitinivibrionales bacterium]|nr:radical SAM protein [Chitinivibrionales bacterium]
MVHCTAVYPATPYLCAFLRQNGIETHQADASLMLVLRLFSKKGLEEVYQALRRANHLPSPASPAPHNSSKQAHGRSTQFFLRHYDRYSRVIDAIIRFLQGTDPSLAQRIASHDFLPEGPRFSVLSEYDSLYQNGVADLFGTMGITDYAQHRASLFVDDIVDCIRESIDSWFGFARYEESPNQNHGMDTFEQLKKRLEETNLIDIIIDSVSVELYEQFKPDVVGFTVPFPGCLYGALRMARKFKALNALCRTVIGGGFVSTELRACSEVQLFSTIDYVCLDDGMRPLLNVLDHCMGKITDTELVRTFIKKESAVSYMSSPDSKDIPFDQWPSPLYDGLPLGSYLSFTEVANPMLRLWSSSRWNKLMLTHGCYWHQCSFCDTSLDYIRRFEMASAIKLVDTIEASMEQTGQSGFHFVDEAAPPGVLQAIAEELLARKCVITWWGNVRFDTSFTRELVLLLRQSGCIAVTGGLEALLDRLLKLLRKGFTLAKAAKVAKFFADAGILVHAYLMYGVPSQTLQEHVDSLELLRQLFSEGCIHSAYWHRFSVTIHSDTGLNPKHYGITIQQPTSQRFTCNDVAFTDTRGVSSDRLADGMKRAVYNYMHGIGLDRDVRSWFLTPVPRPSIPNHLIKSYIT